MYTFSMITMIGIVIALITIIDVYFQYDSNDDIRFDSNEGILLIST